MKRIFRLCLIALTLATVAPTAVQSQETKSKGYDEFDIIRLGRRLKGRIVDYTGNHGRDHRMWSRSLHQWRDLYVYLPPGYCPDERYPLVIFLHPFAFDERTFLRLVPYIDAAIACGTLPPMIVISPDGATDGKGCIERPGSFFLNSNAGNFEDFLLQDVWDFVCQRYSIRPERNAHVLAGMSMGGFAAYNIGLRHRDAFGIVIGLHPPLNLRWCDVDGNPRAKFDPRRWGWRTGFDNHNEVLATFNGIVRVKMGPLLYPIFGVGDDALLGISHNNPLELVVRSGLRNGDLSMFVGYAGRDEFNIDAQVESFLYYAKFKGLGVAVAYEPDGHHDAITALKMLPAVFRWLGPQLEPYAPGRCETCR